MKPEIIKKDHWPKGTYIEISQSVFPERITIIAYEDGYSVGEYRAKQDANDKIENDIASFVEIRGEEPVSVMINKIQKKVNTIIKEAKNNE